MAYTYNPKTKSYEDNTPTALNRPARNYNFKLDPSTFSKKYLSYKYTPQEFGQLAQSGYVGSYGNGVLGVKAPAYDAKAALEQIRKGNTPAQFRLPDNYVGHNLIDVVETPNPTGLQLLEWTKRAEKFDLNKYVAQYGHVPSTDSVYYQFFDPSGAAAPALDKARGNAVEAYQTESDKIAAGKLYALATATKDPNLQALSTKLPGLRMFTPAERAKVTGILRDFGLTAAGNSTIPENLGSKYLLPVSALGMGPAGVTQLPGGKTTTTSGISASAGNDSLVSKAMGVSPILSLVAQNSVYKDLNAQANKGILAATPASEVTPLSFLTNAIKGVARAGLGFPMGVYAFATDPIGTGTAMLKDYGKRYGGLWGDPNSNFIASTLEDPTVPILDVLGLVPIVGAGAKAAQFAKVASITGKGAHLAEAERVANARIVLESARGSGGVWAEKGAGVLEAKARIANSSTFAKEQGLIKIALDKAKKVIASNTLNADGLNAAEEAAYTTAKNRHDAIVQANPQGPHAPAPKPSSFINPTDRHSEAMVSAARNTLETGVPLTKLDSAGKISRMGESIREFARVQNDALNGNAHAAVTIGEMAPEGYHGLNSSYAPTFVDRAAAFFEPRWSTFSPADTMGSLLEGKLNRENFAKLTPLVQENLAAGGSADAVINTSAPIRFTGSPIARALQKTFFSAQKAVARKGIDSSANPAVRAIAGTFMSMPLLGFNYRYAKALTTDVNSVGTLVQRELMQHRMFEELINVDGKHKLGAITDPEQLAIMSQVSGGMYDPSILRSIAARRLEIERANPGHVAGNTKDLIQTYINDLNSPEFMAAYRQATHEMLTGSTERGVRLARARDHFRQKHDMIHHEAGVELSRLDINALARIYAPAINAFGLEPKMILNAIEKVVEGGSKRLAVFNDNFHLFETSKVIDLPANKGDLTLLQRINAGEFDRARGKRPAMSRAEALAHYKNLMDTFEAARQVLKSNNNYRSMGNAPFFVVEKNNGVRTGVFGQKTIRGRMVHITGDVGPNGWGSMNPEYVSSHIIELPSEIFRKSEKNRKSVLHYGAPDKNENLNPHSDLYDQLQRGGVNYLMKMFPDARDFSDKASLETMKGRETFADFANANTIAASGLLDYHLKVQFQAHREAVNRRFNKDIQSVVEQSAVPMLLSDFMKQNKAKPYVALKTLKFHTDLPSAQNYADSIGLDGTVEKGQVMYVSIGGKQHYVTRMQFIDSSSVALDEARTHALSGANVWKDGIFADQSHLNTVIAEDPNALIMVTPRKLVDDLTKSYERSHSLASKIFSGSTDIFKMMALSLNPRFVSQQIFGGTVMLMLADPQNAGHILAKFMEYSHRNMARAVKNKYGHTITNEFVNHGDDYDIIMNRFIRDFEDNIYMQDAHQSFIGRYGENANRVGQKVSAAANIGYTVSFALEKNLRVAIARKAALNFPGFNHFMKSEAVAKHAAEGLPEMGYTTVSPFAAAMDLLSDPRSMYHNPMFLREVRHTADMVSGNYRDFTKAERAVRNFAIPFYAWTRHSAMFTKRLIQERPLTANSVYNTGNYGYEQLFERGGMPDWLLESVPMPNFVKEVLGVDPNRENRIGFGSINPFGAMANAVTTLGGVATGGSLKGGAFQFTNPFINSFIEQQTGKSLLTGAPSGDSMSSFMGIPSLPGMPGRIQTTLAGLPLPKLIAQAYTQETMMNQLRGNTNPLDIFKDPYAPDSKLGIPQPKLNYKFPTQSPAGLFNSFTPFSVYSLDPKQLGIAIATEATQHGIAFQNNKMDMNKGAWRTINALSKWMATRDYVNNVWIPQFGDQNPATKDRVLKQLALEYPHIPDTFPQGMVNQVLNGQLSPDMAAKQVVSYNPGARAAANPVSGPANTNHLVAANSSDPTTIAYDRPAGSVNVVPTVTISSNGYVFVNNRPYMDQQTGKQVKYVVNAKGEIVYDSSGNPIIDVKGMGG